MSDATSPKSPPAPVHHSGAYKALQALARLYTAVTEYVEPSVHLREQVGPVVTTQSASLTADGNLVTAEGGALNISSGDNSSVAAMGCLRPTGEPVGNPKDELYLHWKGVAVTLNKKTREVCVGKEFGTGKKPGASVPVPPLGSPGT
jgi:hypothetical protein